MNGYKLIYHDKESSTGGVSPFDKAVTEIVKNISVSIDDLWIQERQRGHILQTQCWDMDGNKTKV